MLVQRPRSDLESVLAASASPAALLHDLLRWAVLAPSRHNAQPWIFDIAGEEVAVHADPSRALPAADPDGRQLVMACGGSIVNLRVAAAHHGHATSVEVCPGVHDDGLLARVRLEERQAATEEVEALFQAIPRRRTNRLPLDGREPPEGLVTALLRVARREGVFLEPVEPHQRAAVAELVAEADRRQWADPRFRTELAAWTRPNASGRRDGLFGWTQGMGDAASMLEPLRIRMAGRGDQEAERDRRRALATPTLLALATPDDGPAAWLAAGKALQRVLLCAAVAGLSASYFSQPVEHPDLRRRLADAIGTTGRPQALFRLGYGLDVRGPPRRPVEEVVRGFGQVPPPAAALVVRRSPSA